MKSIMKNAVQGARDVLRNVVNDIQGLDDDFIVTRYVKEHKGQPNKMIEFARQSMPEGADVFEQAVRYEDEMENLLKNARGGV